MNFDNILFSVLLIRILFHAFGQTKITEKKKLYTPYSVLYDGNNYNNMVSNKISLIVYSC